MQNLHNFKKELDKISPTFCVAKWKQVTMHLESGLTHSCHHPKAHIVPLDELKENISALHNTKYKKRMRKDMLEGKIIPECEYCNKFDSVENVLSDRIRKSSDKWARKYIPEIIENSWDYDVFPSYFEVSFSSVCNCSCIYCSPTFSTGWVKEIEKFGGYPTSTSSRDFNDSAIKQTHNPYIEAFWKWWPDLYQNLDFFRITGGEPLLSKDTFKILDYIIENPRLDLDLSINSNFCVNAKIFTKFIDKYEQIAKNHKSVKVFTSCEAVGEKAEYIRPGLKYNEWLTNCRNYLLKIPNGTLTFMCTYNVLSISSFKEFLKDVLKLKQEFLRRVRIDIPLLIHPFYLQTDIITEDFLKYIDESITFMHGTIFGKDEISKLYRIYYLLKTKSKNIGPRKDFAIFIDEHDRRYGTNFLKIFPEYKDFYYRCKK